LLKLLLFTFGKIIATLESFRSKSSLKRLLFDFEDPIQLKQFIHHKLLNTISMRKKITFWIFMFLLAVPLLSHAQVNFVNQYDYVPSTPNHNHNNGLIQLADGNMLSMDISATSTNVLHFNKFDPAGNILWVRNIDVPFPGVAIRDEFNSISPTNDNGFIVSFNTVVPSSQWGEVYTQNIIKFDALGAIDWQKNVEVTDDHLFPVKILQKADGSYISLCHYAKMEINPVINPQLNYQVEDNVALLHLDNTGNTIWHKEYDFDVNQWYDHLKPRDFCFDSNENIVITGIAHAGAFVMKVDANGVFQWERMYLPSSLLGAPASMVYEGGEKIIAVPGGFVLNSSVGTNPGPGNGPLQYLESFIRIDNNGNIVFEKYYKAPSDNFYLSDGLLTAAGTLLYSGKSRVNATQNVRGYIFEIDVNLNHIASTIYDSDFNDDQYFSFNHVVEVNPNEFWFSGDSHTGDYLTASMSVFKNFVVSWDKGGQDICTQDATVEVHLPPHSSVGFDYEAQELPYPNDIFYTTYDPNYVESIECCEYEVTISTPINVCPGEQVTLFADLPNPAATYTVVWYDPQGFPIPTGNGVVVTVPNTPGMAYQYTVTVTDVNTGCLGTGTYTMVVGIIPTVTSTLDLDVCSDDCNPILIGQDGPNWNVYYSPYFSPYNGADPTDPGTGYFTSNGQITTTTIFFGYITNYWFTPCEQTEGSYVITYHYQTDDPTSCPGKAAGYITVCDPPEVAIVNTTANCVLPAILQAAQTTTPSAACGWTSYAWSGPAGSIVGATNQEFVEVNAQGTYTVTIINEAGCETTETFELNFKEPIVTLEPVPPIDLCTWDGNPIQLNSISNAGTCVWSENPSGTLGNYLDANGLFTPNGVGSYTVFYTCTNGSCVTQEYIQIDVVEGSNWHQYSENSNGGDVGNDVVVDAVGDVYVIGTFRNATTINGGNNPDINISTLQGFDGSYIAKYDACADLLWVTHSNESKWNRGSSIALDEVSGHVYAIGNMDGAIEFENSICGGNLMGSFTGVTQQGYVLRMDMATGCPEFISAIAPTDFTELNSIVVDETENSIFVGGRTMPVSSTFTRTLVHKYTPSNAGIGAIDWQIRGVGEGNCVVNDLAFDPIGQRLWMIGDYDDQLRLSNGANITFLVTTNGVSDAFVASYVDQGPLPPLYELHGGNANSQMTGNGIAVDPSGNNIYVTGTYTTNSSNVFDLGGSAILSNPGGQNAYQMKIDYPLGGGGYWIREADGNQGRAFGVDVDYRDGSAFFTGNYLLDDITFQPSSITEAYYTIGGGALVNHTYVVAYDELGNYLWHNVTKDPNGNSAEHSAMAIAAGPNSQSFVVGAFTQEMDYLAGAPSSGVLSSSGIGTNAFVMRSNQLTGEFRSAAAGNSSNEEEVAVIKLEDDLQAEVWPNPSRGDFTLEVSSGCEIISLEIVDIQGRVLEHMQTIQTPNRIQVNIQNASAGLHFIKAQCKEGGVIYTRLMLL